MPNHLSILPNNHHQQAFPEGDPLVTVVIPAFNRLPLLRQAIASVLAQSYSNWELIIADDGSDDGTAEAIMAMNDTRIRLVPTVHIGNIAALRNMGVKEGSGKWLAFLDSDDIWVPYRLEIQLYHLEKEKKRWGYGRFELMDEALCTIPNKAGSYHPISGWIAEEVLSTEASVSIGAIMVERTFFEEVGGFNEDAELLYREDYDLAIRLALKAEALAIPDLMVRIREHVGRATHAFASGHDRMAAVYKRFILAHPDQVLSKMASRRMAHELAESASQKIREKKYLQAAGRLGKAMMNGDSLRHLLSSVRRGFASSH